MSTIPPLIGHVSELEAIKKNTWKNILFYGRVLISLRNTAMQFNMAADAPFACNWGDYLGNTPGKTIPAEGWMHFKESSWKYYDASYFAKKKCFLHGANIEHVRCMLTINMLKTCLVGTPGCWASNLSTTDEWVRSWSDHVPTINKVLQSIAASLI